MQPATQTTNRHDALDIEAFETMMASKSFAVFKERIAGELARAQNDCETFDDKLALRRAQGGAKAFRVVLALPDAILKSMKGKK